MDISDEFLDVSKCDEKIWMESDMQKQDEFPISDEEYEVNQTLTDGLSTDIKEWISDCQCYASCYRIMPFSFKPELITVIVTSSVVLKIFPGASPVKHEIKDSKFIKVLIHHEFLPSLQCYLAMLSENNMLEVRNFNNFKLISQFSNVQNMKSVSKGISEPSLIIIKVTGEEIKWSSSLCDQSSKDSDVPKDGGTGKEDAVDALEDMIQESIKCVTRLEKTIDQQTCFIEKRVGMIKKKMRDGNSSEKTNCDSNPACVISSIRHKILYGDRLLICCSIQNKSKSDTLRKFNLTLSSAEFTLSYTFDVFKSVSRRRNPNSSNSRSKESDKPIVAVEKMEPNVLSPGKRVFVIARCTLPTMSMNSFSIGGILSYEQVSSSQQASKYELLRQVPLPPFKLDALQILKSSVKINSDPPKSGVSLDSLSLITGGDKFSLLLSSLHGDISVCSVLESLRQHSSLKKVEDLTDVHVFSDPGILQFTVLHFKVNPDRKILLNIHCKNVQNAAMVIQILRTCLPKYVTLSSGEKIFSTSVSEFPSDSQTKHNLSLLREAVSFLMETLSVSDNDQSKKQKMDQSCQNQISRSRVEYESTRRLLEGERSNANSMDLDSHNQKFEQFKQLVVKLENNLVMSNPV